MPRGLQIGEKFPVATVFSLGGEEVPLASLCKGPTVLETGSITCGLYCGRITGMNQLMNEFPDFNFLLLYVREAHPGSRIPAHASMHDKLACARKLCAAEAEQRTVIVDRLEGTVHQELGAWPNMIFVINANGNIVHRGDWNHVETTRHVLQKYRDGSLNGLIDSPFTRAPWRVEARVFRRAGYDALWDFLRQLPMLIWNRWRQRKAKK